MLRRIGKQSGESWSQSGRRKGRLQWEGFAEKEGFKPGVKEWRGDGWWKWWVDGTDGGSATQRTGWCRIGEISAWLTERSRESIPETRGSRVEGTQFAAHELNWADLPRIGPVTRRGHAHQRHDFVGCSETRTVGAQPVLGARIHGVKWRHRIYGHDTIAILWL